MRCCSLDDTMRSVGFTISEYTCESSNALTLASHAMLEIAITSKGIIVITPMIRTSFTSSTIKQSYACNHDANADIINSTEDGGKEMLTYQIV